VSGDDGFGSFCAEQNVVTEANLAFYIFQGSKCLTPLLMADTKGDQGGHAPPPLEAHVPTLPLQKSAESKAAKRDFKNTYFLVFLKFL